MLWKSVLFKYSLWAFPYDLRHSLAYLRAHTPTHTHLHTFTKTPTVVFLYHFTTSVFRESRPPLVSLGISESGGVMSLILNYYSNCAVVLKRWSRDPIPIKWLYYGPLTVEMNGTALRQNVSFNDGALFVSLAFTLSLVSLSLCLARSVTLPLFPSLSLLFICVFVVSVLSDVSEALCCVRAQCFFFFHDSVRDERTSV